MIYLQLFLSFFQIGLFSFGGGYAAMPLIQGQVVQGHGWLSMSEFTDLITISQMTPGPIAVNSATFVGIKIAGVPGALAATFGCILPSCILVTLLAKLYLKYREMAMLQGILRSLRPAVVAMIGSAGISILVTAFWSSEGVATRTTVINDPVGIHARPAAQFTQAVTASGCTVTIAKEGGNPVSANSILSVMGLGIKQGESVVIDVQGADDETVADNLLNILVNAE